MADTMIAPGLLPYVLSPATGSQLPRLSPDVNLVNPGFLIRDLDKAGMCSREDARTRFINYSLQQVHKLKVTAVESRTRYQEDIRQYEAALLRKENSWKDLQSSEDAVNQAVAACYYFNVALQDGALSDGRDVIFMNAPLKHGSEFTKPSTTAYYSPWPKFIRQLPNANPGLSDSPRTTPPTSPSTEDGIYLSDKLDVDMGTNGLKSALEGTLLAQ